MASDWREVTVSEIAASERNALVGGPFGSNLVSSDYVPSGVPVIRGQNMGGRWVSGEFAHVSDGKAESLNANIARPGDIVFTQRGTLGQVSIVPKGPYDRYVISQSQMKLMVNPELADSLFYYYVFSTIEQQDYIRQHAIQTGVPHTNLGILRRTPIPFPPLPEQRAIAHILGSLDDKIELNRSQNETLEAMARALFKSWFVDFDPVHTKADGRQPAGMDLETAKIFPREFSDSVLGPIPKGWRHVPVSDVCDGLFDGPHATPPEASCGAIFLGIKNFTPTSLDLTEIRFISEEDLPRWTKRVTPVAGDIVFTYEATLGFFALIPPGIRCCLGRRTALVRPKARPMNGHYLFEWFVAPPFQEFLRAHQQPGSTVDRIWLKDFPDYPVLMPSDSLVRKFEETVTPIWAQIHANQAASSTLRGLRDVLLTQLLSGEIRVNTLNPTREGLP
jgi:type I restriction enzyme, S subunit